LVKDKAPYRAWFSAYGALGTAQGAGAIMGVGAGSYLYKMVRIDVWGAGFNSHYSPFVVSAMALTACVGLAVMFIREGDGRRIGMAEGG